MTIAKIEVSGVRAAAGNHAIIPAGILGASVSFRFTDSRWEALTKTAVFQGCVTRDVLMEGDTVVVPQECVAWPGMHSARRCLWHKWGAVSAAIDGLTTTSYTIPAGYHNGSGTVRLTGDIEAALAAI